MAAAASKAFGFARRGAGRVSAGSLLSYKTLEEEEERGKHLDTSSSDDENDLLARLYRQDDDEDGEGQALFAQNALDCVMTASRALAKDRGIQKKILEALADSWEFVDVPGGASVSVYDSHSKDQIMLADTDDSSVDGYSSSEDSVAEELADEVVVALAGQRASMEVRAPLREVEVAEDLVQEQQPLAAVLMGRATKWIRETFQLLMRGLVPPQSRQPLRREQAPQDGEQEVQVAAPPQAAQPQLPLRQRLKQISLVLVKSERFQAAVVAGAACIILYSIFRQKRSGSGFVAPASQSAGPSPVGLAVATPQVVPDPESLKMLAKLRSCIRLSVALRPTLEMSDKMGRPIGE